MSQPAHTEDGGHARAHSRLRVADQQVQPLLLMFPLGLFATALLFDVACLLGAPAMLGTLAYWNIAAGVVGGGVAAAAGAIDAGTCPDAAIARRAVAGVVLDLGVLTLFAVIALLRLRVPDRRADHGLLTVETAGLAMAAFSAWFGGRLGERRPHGTSGWG
jgi:uncharacterized membrane protein